MKGLTADAVHNLIRMKRSQQPNITMCIVEGGDDIKHYSKFIDPTKCSINIADGWENALGALKKLEDAGILGVLAIVDADLTRVVGTSVQSPNHLRTDHHDLEIDLIVSDAFDPVIGEVCDFEQTPHPPPADIRKCLFEVATPIAYLRLHSYNEKHNLKFKELTYSDFIDRDTLALDERALITAVKNKSRRPDLADTALLAGMRKEVSVDHDHRHLCRGHDMTSVLSLALRKHWANQKPAEVTPSRLEQLLRAAYNISHFVKTALYAAIRSWESSNQPFLVLRWPCV